MKDWGGQGNVRFTKEYRTPREVNVSDRKGARTYFWQRTPQILNTLGTLIAERVRAMGVKPFYKHFKHNGVNGPNMATVFSDQGFGVRAPVVFYNRSNEASAQLKPGDFDWQAIFAGPDRGMSLEAMEKEMIRQALERTNRNKAKAARLLGISYDTLRYQVKKFGLE